MDDLTYETRYESAKKEVACIKSFYNHLIIYVVIITGLAAFNYWTNGWSYAWFLWTAFGWGIGLIIHAVRTFVRNPFLNKDWEERKIREFMNKER